MVRFFDFADGYYVKDGQPTKELTSLGEAAGRLRTLYGNTPARDFGPLRLKAVREYMIKSDLARGTVNHHVNRLKRILKWTVSEELVPPSIYEGVRTVAGLRYGRSEARETTPVGPVPDAWVDAVLPHLSPPVAAMIELQRLTGARPGEIVAMRLMDIDREGEVWHYTPATHKNAWRGHRRVIPLGPRAQEIVRRFLLRASDSYLFSPREAEDWRNERRAEHRNPERKTKVFPCELRARERRRLRARQRRVKRPPTDQYTVDTYRRALEYGIRKVNRTRKKADPEADEIPHWHPHQLRHRFATEIRRKFGVEAAQIALGHARTDVVEVYAEKNFQIAAEIACKIG